jgi:hypothetical protein
MSVFLSFARKEIAEIEFSWKEIKIARGLGLTYME